MWEILCLLIGMLAGAGGLFVWARSNKKKAVNLLNMDFEAKVDEMRNKIDNEFDNLTDEARKELNDMLDKLKG